MNYFSDYHDHHLKLIETLKTALYARDSSIFEKLDYYNEEIYAEPLFYACINNNFAKWIDTLIFGFAKEQKPIWHINTTPIEEKLIYLPNTGYLELKSKYSKQVSLRYIDNVIEIRDIDGNILDYESQELIKNELGIEFFKCNHPLLKPLFVDEQGEITDVIINQNLFANHTEHFNKALHTIKKVYPEYFNLIVKYIKKVVFFKGSANSFATIQAHGISFFNIKDDYDEIFFVDNIMHQCAHAFFNTLTLHKSDLFTIAPSSDLSMFTKDKSDIGAELYDRFHGLFTQSNINICLEKCIQQKLFNGDKHNELLGRFSSNMKRFSVALEKFENLEIYKAVGIKWLEFFKETYTQIHQRNRLLLSKYNVSNQSYVFDYNIFLST